MKIPLEIGIPGTRLKRAAVVLMSLFLSPSRGGAPAFPCLWAAKELLLPEEA